MMPARAALLLALALALPSGCSAVRSLNSAARALDAYELVPVAIPGAGSTGRSLAVEEPAASAAIATDRILVKPNPLAVAYLPGARWIEPAPAHVQSLIIRSLAGSGRVGFVGPAAAGPLPDYDLFTTIEAFEADIDGSAQPPVRVVVAMTLTLVRDLDGQVVASRRFEGSATAPADHATAVVSAFNVAMSGILREAGAWTIAAMAGGGV